MDPKNSITGCRNPAQFFGEWMIDAQKLEELREYAQRFDLVAIGRLAAEREDKMEAEAKANKEAGKPEPKPYTIIDGVAIFSINGPTLKYPDSFNAGTSTVKLVRQMRLAMNDPEVNAGLLRLEDAPGGTVAGAFELRDAIEAFAKVKPMDGIALDLCCSAAYLFGSACKKLYANPTALVGSIGVLAQLKDTKEAHDKAGVKVIPLSTGAHKHTGMPGVEITPEQIAQRQAHIDQLGQHFYESVAKHRGMKVADIKELGAGIFLAEKAVELKLIDGIDSFENCLNRLKSECQTMQGRENPAFNPTGSADTMNLLQQIQAILKDSSLTEAQAIAKISALTGEVANHQATISTLNETIKGLNAKLSTLEPLAGKVEPAEILSGRAELLGERLEVAVGANKVSVPVANAIKSAAGVGENAKPVAVMLSPRAELGNKSVADWAMGLFSMQPAEQPKDGPKAKQSLNPFKRTVPGGDQANKEDEEATQSADEDIEAMGLKVG